MLLRNLGAILYVVFLYVSYIWYSVPGIKLNTLSGDKLRCIKRSHPTTDKLKMFFTETLYWLKIELALSETRSRMYFFESQMVVFS